MRKLILSAFLATSAMTIAAQPVHAEPERSEADAKFNNELKSMEKLFSNMFSTKDAGPIDPQRLSQAKQALSQIMPEGIYSKMMNGMMDKVMGAMFVPTGGMSNLEISMTTGVDVDESVLDDATRKAVTDLLDPNHAQRTAAMKTMLNPLMDKMARVIEPPMREGLARAYARKFSAEQLTDLNGFFATPTGRFYAGESFLLQADPEVMQAVFGAMPALFGELANPGADIEKALAAIPPAKKLSDLSSDEKASLAKMLGTTADMLVSTDTAAASAADASADAAAPDPFANESGTEPWWDRENWDKADQKTIAVLESKSDAMVEQSTAASDAYLNFETEVMLRVRERYLAKGWKPSESSE